MKKIACICALVPSIAFAETEFKKTLTEEAPNEITIDDTVYVRKYDANVRFFVGIDMPLVFYSTEDITFDLGGHDVTRKHSELRLNENILDGTSLSFGFDIDNMLRIGFDFSKSNTTTKLDKEKQETDIGHYGVYADGFLYSTKIMSPFIRLGIGCITAKKDSVDYSSVFFRAGIGANYKITENTFSYVLMDYTFIPQGDIDDIDASIDGNVFSISVGMGYKF